MKKCYANIRIEAYDETAFEDALSSVNHLMKQLNTDEGKIESDTLDIITSDYIIKGTIDYDGRSEAEVKFDEELNQADMKYKSKLEDNT